jgi:hypothetical protein
MTESAHDDVYELLRELRRPFAEDWDHDEAKNYIERIDAALAQRPEPIGKIISWDENREAQAYCVVKVYEGSPVITGSELYAVLPSAAALIAEQAAEIEHLKEHIRLYGGNGAAAIMECLALRREKEAVERALAELQERMMVLLALQLKRFEPETVPAPPAPALAVPGHLKGEPDGRGHSG